MLSLDALERVLGLLNIKIVVLGGGEPTLDKKIINIIDILNRLNIYSILLTNASNVDESFMRELEEAGLKEACVSIKAYTDDIHIFYTGKSNKRVLYHFNAFAKSKIKLRAESILIPRVIDRTEIERIAEFIASVNSSIPYRIDNYIPVPQEHWDRPSPEDVRTAAESARKYLKNVSFLTALKGNAINIYPEV